MVGSLSARAPTPSAVDPGFAKVFVGATAQQSVVVVVVVVVVLSG